MRRVFSVVAVVAGGAIATLAWSAEPAADTSESTGEKPVAVKSVDEARRQAAALHTVLHASLQRVHDGYFEEDAGMPIPAAVLRDVFDELKQDQNIVARWLVVEGQAMNVDHKASTPFEKEAVRVLVAGEPAHEELSEGIYRRAAPIRLRNHCLKCHVPNRKSTRDHTAGLILAIPISE
jgi:hypothetical protein